MPESKNPIEYRNHGGSCCGRGHFCNFGRFPIDSDYDDDEVLWAHIEKTKKKLTALRPGIVYEVVLNEYQLEPWEPIVLEAGFKKTLSWRNINSGKMCHMYLYLNPLKE